MSGGKLEYSRYRLEEIIKTLEDEIASNEKPYYDNPDNLLHAFGINSDIVKKEFERINSSLEFLCNNIEDSVVIILADHGHIDTKHYILDDYANIKNNDGVFKLYPASDEHKDQLYFLFLLIYQYHLILQIYEEQLSLNLH